MEKDISAFTQQTYEFPEPTSNFIRTFGPTIGAAIAAAENIGCVWTGVDKKKEKDYLFLFFP